MIYPFDNSDPPAPVLEITVIHPEMKDWKRQCDAKLDTGADITAIPTEIGVDWNLSHSFIEIEGCHKDEIKRYRPVYKIRIFIHGHHSEKPLENEIEVVGLEREDALIGRDLSNNWNIHLCGKVKPPYFEIEF